MRFFFMLILGLVTLPALAEYRAFELAITDTRTGKTRLVTSVLDDIQYPGYHPIHRYETIAIQATWMCWGRQGDFKAICRNPRADDASGPTANSTRAPGSAPSAP